MHKIFVRIPTYPHYPHSYCAQLLNFYPHLYLSNLSQKQVMHQVIHIIHIPQDNIPLPHLPLSFRPQDLYTYHKLANIDKNNPKMLDFSAFMFVLPGLTRSPMKSNSLVILDGQCQLSVSEGYAKETGRISCFKKVISSRLSTISSEKRFSGLRLQDAWKLLARRNLRQEQKYSCLRARTFFSRAYLSEPPPVNSNFCCKIVATFG